MADVPPKISNKNLIKKHVVIKQSTDCQHLVAVSFPSKETEFLGQRNFLFCFFFGNMTRCVFCHITFKREKKDW